jgi:hypothetical protein
LPFSANIFRAVSAVTPGTVHVLDLGAGSLKVIGKYLQRTRILRADGDALAPGHDQLLEKYSFISLVRTIFGIAEDVATQLSHGVFDLAHACKTWGASQRVKNLAWLSQVAVFISNMMQASV